MGLPFLFDIPRLTCSSNVPPRYHVGLVCGYKIDFGQNIIVKPSLGGRLLWSDLTWERNNIFIFTGKVRRSGLTAAPCCWHIMQNRKTLNNH